MAKPTKTKTTADPEIGNIFGMPAYFTIAGVIVLIAIIFTVITDIAVKPGSCTNLVGGKDYNCMEKLAYMTSNTQLCAGMPSYYADSCYASIAEKTSNQALCTRASDSNVSNSCTMYIANATKNPSLCANLGGFQKADCIDNIAVYEQAPVICVQLSSQADIDTCIAAIYMSKAVSTSDGRYCQFITSNNNQTVAFSALQISGLESNPNYLNISQALAFSALGNFSIGARDACYISIAYITSNKTYCADTSSAVAEMCNFTSLRFKQPSSNQTSANYTAFLNLCTQTASYSRCNDTVGYLEAISTKNASRCGQLSANYSGQCYYTMAEIYNTTKYCNYIKNATLNLQCIESIDSGYYHNPNNLT